jgi:plasmid stabilization system protein ParE
VGKIVWSPTALKDADSIAEFIARDSVDRAALFVLRLIEAKTVYRIFHFQGILFVKLMI